MNPPDLSTRYLGLELASPLVVSSCPLTGDVHSALELERSGAAAIVLPSLFQEQVEHEELELARLHQAGAESFVEATNYVPELESFDSGLEGYLELVERQREALSIPVIASLNGVSRAGWAHYARLVEEAGAQALELNLLYVPTDPRLAAADVEALYLEQIAAVTGAVSIPVAVKIGAHLSAPAHFAAHARAAGASGIVLFNRSLEPDIELETMEVVPRLELSHASEMRQALRWTAILSPGTELSLAATGGARTAEDVLKLVLAGADVVMIVSELLRHGPQRLRAIRSDLSAWLGEQEVDALARIRGSMNHRNCPNPAGYERLNYMRALLSYSGPHV